MICHKAVHVIDIQSDYHTERDGDIGIWTCARYKSEKIADHAMILRQSLSDGSANISSSLYCILEVSISVPYWGFRWTLDTTEMATYAGFLARFAGLGFWAVF